MLIETTPFSQVLDFIAPRRNRGSKSNGLRLGRMPFRQGWRSVLHPSAKGLVSGTQPLLKGPLIVRTTFGNDCFQGVAATTSTQGDSIPLVGIEVPGVPARTSRRCEA